MVNTIGSIKSGKSRKGSDVNAVVSDTESEVKMEAPRSTTRRSRSSRRSSCSSQNHIKHFVEHNYHDHKYDPVEYSVPSISMIDEGSFPKRAGHKGGVSTPFPEKLHEMLETIDREGNNEVVGWQPHGRCFVVHKPREFVETIMPKFFKQSKLTSFQRQLNLYGFSRLTAGPDRGGYYHELFIRGRSDLCARMVRTRVKGNGSKAASSPSTEPNFYTMEPCNGPVDDEQIHPSVPNCSSGSFVNDDEEGSSEKACDELPLTMDEEELAEEFSRTQTPEPTIVTSDDKDPVMEEDPMTPVSQSAPFWDDQEEDDLGVISLEKTIIDAKFTSLPPIVTPLQPATRKLVSKDKFPPLLPSMASLEDISAMQEGLEAHSGDQVFFEGLPFHYLESKDIEDSLIHGETQCI
mmetsp:Transcript_2384/g.3912  ORF Transcript_2384/g.3912 Transcript_2384/m.3912 type:complete len:406 (+) Transcript_2384:47-1264(+)